MEALFGELLRRLVPQDKLRRLRQQRLDSWIRKSASMVFAMGRVSRETSRFSRPN